MAKRPPTNKAHPLLLALIIACAAAGLGLAGWQFYQRDPGRDRSACHGKYVLASPGWFHDDWCVQVEITSTSVDQDGADVVSSSWVGECFATKDAAVASCAAKP